MKRKGRVQAQYILIYGYIIAILDIKKYPHKSPLKSTWRKTFYDYNYDHATDDFK